MKTCKKCQMEKPLEDFYVQKGCRDGRRPECKVCFNAALKAHRAANVDAYRERDRKRYANNPARQEAQKKTARAHYAANRDAGLKYRREHYESNKDAYAGYVAKRRATKRAVEHQPYTRTGIFERDQGICRMCGVLLKNEPHGFALDHIVPLCLGGPDTPANLQLTCQPCNRSKWMNLEGQIHLPV